MDELEKKGLRDNTIVVFTYDHGGKDYVNHGEFFHGFATLWEGGIRVPLIIRNPFVEKAKTVDTRLAIHMDITATLLNAAFVSIDDLDGVDLMTNTIDLERALFWRFPLNRNGRNPQSAIRQGKWKLIYDVTSRLLFNLDEDRSERFEVGYQFQTIKDSLVNKLETWLEEIKNPSF